MNLLVHKNATDYAANGPMLMTRFGQLLCQKPYTKDMTRENCHGFEVLPTELFFPIGYEARDPLFNMAYAKQTLEIVKNSYAVHQWDGLFHLVRLKVGTKAAIGIMAEQNCPKVYASCGQLF